MNKIVNIRKNNSHEDIMFNCICSFNYMYQLVEVYMYYIFRIQTNNFHDYTKYYSVLKLCWFQLITSHKRLFGRRKILF